MLIAAALVLSVGFSIRLWASTIPYILHLTNINEVVSPLTSWKRVTEGLFLKRNGISPYEGDVFHQTPMLLSFMDLIESRWSNVIGGIFVGLDVVAAVAIGLAAQEIGKFMILMQHKNKQFYHKDVGEEKHLTADSFRNVFVYAAAVYMFNPYSLTACIAKSTAVVDNIILATLVTVTLRGQKVSATFMLALAAYQNFYSIMLIVPVALCLVQKDMLGRVHYLSTPAIKSILLTVVLTAAWLAALLYYSFTVVGSWAFLRSTYGFILLVPELTPNMGIFWYFFTEMFAHFEQFFIIVFQVNAFIYTIPLAIKFRHHPIFLLYTLLVIMSIFKSYPSYADIGFYLSFLPCWGFVHKYMRNTFIVTNMYIWCAVLSPIFYYLWIYSGSANANFYFALTLVSSAAQIFYLSDLMFAYLRRDFDLYHIKPSGESKAKDSAEVDDVLLK